MFSISEGFGSQIQVSWHTVKTAIITGANGRFPKAQTLPCSPQLFQMKTLSRTNAALTRGPVLAIVFLLITLSARSDSARVDFRYSPPEWQTAICLPDDPCKSLVDRSGDLLYHYGQGGREFATRISLEVVSNAAWQKQELLSPRIPIVQTSLGAEGLKILQEAFTITDLSSGKPTAIATDVPARNDLILVRITNTSSRDLLLNPRLIVDTTLPFRFQSETRQAQVNGHETITCSLRMAGLAQEQGSRRIIDLEPVPVGARQEALLFVLYSGGGSIVLKPGSIEEAVAARAQAVAYWEHAPLPFGRVEIPEPGIQALVDSSIRNIWQAREIKKGLPAFQVGPTCYRGLWIVDGAFLLESAAMLGAGKEARNGVAYELTYQRPDGSIHVMDNYSKENGIVLWTCIRHAQLTQDEGWLESVWPQLERIAAYIQTLRRQTLTNSSPRDDGLVPAGFPDGGIGGVLDEYTNPYWNLAGLHSFVQAAQWLGKTHEAENWQAQYDDFMSAFRRYSKRDRRVDPHGHPYLPIRMDGQDLPQRGQWAFCHAVYPGQIFSQKDPLVEGTLAMLQDTEQEGMVYGTGWDPTGIWNYFGSFYGHAWLWQGNGQKAAQVLTAYANHAAPTLVWREEQSLHGQKFKKVGDMPHNWASAEFIRLVIHLLELDRGDELHLLEGLPTAWTGPGMLTRLNGVATPFGPLEMTLQIDRKGTSAKLSVNPLASNCKAIVVHLPNGRTKKISPRKGGNVTFGVSPQI